jgi:hypothetical protein
MTISEITISRAGALRSRSARARQFARTPVYSAGGALLCALSLGCTSDAVDLGGGVVTQELSSGSRCAESPIIDDNVLVTSQEELAALEGCEEIDGELNIQMFADADLTPLHELRAVASTLVLGSSAQNFLSEEDFQNAELLQAITDRESPLLGTWLDSLEGLESLERVGGLMIADTGLTDLAPLAQLERIDGSASAPSLSDYSPGELYLLRNPALRDLTGLEGASGVRDLELYFNEGLLSLSGFVPGPTLHFLDILDTPSLTDIDALANVTSIGGLVLSGTGLADLDALSALATIDSIDIENNPALADVSGLDNLQGSGQVVFSGNAALKALPSFSKFYYPPLTVTVTDNPELEELNLDLQLSNATFVEVGSGLHVSSTELIRVVNNAKLRSVVFAPSVGEKFGLKATQVVALEKNASLTRVDFGGLQRADVLSIDENPVLSEVTLGDLANVDSLEVTDNPALDASVFAPVSTFERTSSGNAAELVP